MLVRFDYRREGAGHDGGDVLRCGRRDGGQPSRWQRPLHGSRSFVDFYEDGEDDCEESLDAWEADYRAQMASGRLMD